MFAFVCSLQDEISVQLPKMQHKSDKYGENGTKTLEFLQRQICVELHFRIELEP